MIPGLESIPEHPFCGFDSDSDSRIKRNHNAYRGVIVVGLESIPESAMILADVDTELISKC